VAGDLSKPECEVSRGLDGREVLVEVQEDFLSQLLCQRSIAQKMQRQAEDHTLMLANNFGKRRLIAQGRPRQGVLWPGSPSIFQCDCPFPPHHTHTTLKNLYRMHFYTRAYILPLLWPGGHKTFLPSFRIIIGEKK
jgi:hypothetical protein